MSGIPGSVSRGFSIKQRTAPSKEGLGAVFLQVDKKEIKFNTHNYSHH